LPSLRRALFETGVSLAVLERWLGESAPALAGETPDEDAAPSRTRVAWDCLSYEVAFQHIQHAIALAPESAQSFAVDTLAAASQIHVLSKCAARSVGEDLWVIERQCLKHLWDSVPEAEVE
jgi:hypothetical protein